MQNLNRRQILFVLEYLKDLNATQAAIRAGYSERTARSTGHENLTKPDIAAAIKSAMAQRVKRTEVNADSVIQELAAIAFAQMDTYATWGPGGVELKSSDVLTYNQLAAVSEVTETPSRHGKSIRFKLHDKLRALELLGQHLGIFEMGDRSDPTLLEKMYHEMTKGISDEYVGERYDSDERPEDKN